VRRKPGDRSPDLANIIVEGLYNGIPLRQLCRENSISKSAVYRWFDEDDELKGRIAHAREHGYHEIADQCVEIADKTAVDAVDVAGRKLQIETRLKLLAKWSPKNYGDKTLVGSDPENPLPPGFTVTLVKAKPA
jgi:hypothetical protein